MNFASWLYSPEPEWKQKLEVCDPRVFEELEMTKEEVEKILEKLKDYNVL